MGQLILARAGATDFDDERRIAGTLDVPLNVKGEAEIQDLAKELRAFQIDTIYSSPEESSKQTAERLARDLDVRVRELAELSNQNFGLWQGLQIDDIKRKHPRAFKQWEDDPDAVCPPEGETVGRALERVRKVLKRLLPKHKDDTIVLVAPEPLRRMIRCALNCGEAPHPWETNGRGPLWELIAPANVSGDQRASIEGAPS